MTLGFGAILLVFCLGGAFLSSGLESGVFAMNRLRIRQWARAGNRRAITLAGWLERPEDFLWTLFVVNAMTGLTAIALSVGWWHGLAGGSPFGFWCGTLAFLFVFYALFDLFPKVLYRTYPNRLCLISVLPMKALRVLGWPLVGVSRAVGGLLSWWGGSGRFTGRLFANREELRRLMQESSHGLTTEERTMIDRVLDVETLSVGRITVPMEKVVAVDAAASMAEVMAVHARHGYTRMPVWEGAGPRRRVAGVVSLRRILYAGEVEGRRSAGEFVRPALYLDEDQRVGAALERMRQTGERLAIVLSRDRREAGIVTLQDILRAMFGEVNL